MATIEEIERHDALIRSSEVRALQNLAAHLREAVIDLPAESQLARAFVKRAKTFEGCVRQRDVAQHGDGELWMLGREVDRAVDVRAQVLGAIADVMEAGATRLEDRDPLKSTLEVEAQHMRGGV